MVECEIETSHGMGISDRLENYQKVVGVGWGPVEGEDHVICHVIRRSSAHRPAIYNVNLCQRSMTK